MGRLPAAEQYAEVEAVICRQWKHSNRGVSVSVTLKNESNVPAFFVRAEVIGTRNGDEILPVTWSDNYVTVFGGESVTLQAHYRLADLYDVPSVRMQGKNVLASTAHLRQPSE